MWGRTLTGLGGICILVGRRVDNPPQLANLPHISTARRFGGEMAPWEQYPKIAILFFFAFWYSLPHEPKTATL
jgi:hypothetical protein